MSEHDEQAALIDWCDFHKTQYPILDYLFAIPNGGKRYLGTARKLKAEGVKPGVLDLFLPVPSQGRHGLFIEMKYGKNTLSDNQKIWQARLMNQGYKVEICYNWEEAAQAIMDYLNLEWEL